MGVSVDHEPQHLKFAHLSGRMYSVQVQRGVSHLATPLLTRMIAWKRLAGSAGIAVVPKTLM